MRQDKRNWNRPIGCNGILVGFCVLLVFGLAFTAPVAAQAPKVEELRLMEKCVLSIAWKEKQFAGLAPVGCREE